MLNISVEEVVYGYHIGVFPMADPDMPGIINWYEPINRGIIPLGGLKVSKSLKKTIEKEIFNISFDQDFAQVISQCAAREETWISKEIIAVYTELFEQGLAHSVEVWMDNKLVGGLYGVALGKAFFGESMFHHATDASKVALVALVAWLKENGFMLLDTQYITPHLASMGAIEIPQKEYLKLLKRALQ
jgi:leucyl/phenylalanyl-tRNA--protein transferase